VDPEKDKFIVANTRPGLERQGQVQTGSSGFFGVSKTDYQLPVIGIVFSIRGAEGI